MNQIYLLLSLDDSVLVYSFSSTISGMVAGITITSPGLLFAVPKHQCLVPPDVTFQRPSNVDDQACHLETADNVKRLAVACSIHSYLIMFSISGY